MRNLLVFGGLSHPNLAKAICRNLTCNEGRVRLRKFSNGEISIEVVDSVRGKDIFIVQSGCGNINDTFIELLIMIAACKSASAARVTAVLPLFPYSRQPDAPHKGRVPKTESGLISTCVSANGYKQWISLNGTLIANLLTTAGADRVITMDLHDPQFQGFFNIPVDNLYLHPLLKHYIIDYIPNYHECVVVSPDSGGAKRATSLADALGCSFALIHKERRTCLTPAATSAPPSAPTNPLPGALPTGVGRALVAVPDTMVATTMLVGDVRDKVCVLVDDIVDTSRTLTRAAQLLKDQGAKYIYVLVTHGVFSGDAIDRVVKLPIDKVITTNSVPQAEHAIKLAGRFQVLDVARILAEAVRRIHNGELVLMLFDHGW